MASLWRRRSPLGFPVIKEGWEIPERNGSFWWESHRESWENVGNPRSKWRFIVCSWENHRTKCVDFPAMFDCQRVTFCKLNWCHSSPSWCAKSNTIPTMIILPKTNRPCRGYKTPAHTSKMGHIHRLSPRKLLLRSWKRPPVDLGSGDGDDKIPLGWSI